MSDDVKRPYRSVVREQQASRTRAAVIDAARAEFVAHGYASTSIDDIAAAAQVARRTVYAVGGKPELLKLAYETALAGDYEQIAERPEVARIVAEPDPVAGLHLYVDMCLGIGARVGPIHAASGDDRVRALYEHFQERRADAGAGSSASWPATARRSAGRTSPPTCCGCSSTPGRTTRWCTSAAGASSRWRTGCTPPSPSSSSQPADPTFASGRARPGRRRVR